MKIVSRKFVDDIKESPTSETKFTEEFDIEARAWENIYRLPFVVTIESKLRSFQFKINHNIFFTNEKLLRVGIGETSMCTFCNTEIETMAHLFGECSYVEPLWDELSDLLDHEFSIKDRIFGLYEYVGFRSYNIHSHAGIILKYYVHICRLNKVNPTVKVFKKRIAYNEFLERKIAQKRGKLGKHFKKWNSLICNINEFRVTDVSENP